MSLRKENLAAPALGLLLACVLFGGCFLVSVKRDRDVLRQILVVTRSNEDRVGEVLQIQWEMTRIMRSILESISEQSITPAKLDGLRARQAQLDRLAARQMVLMKTVASERLPPAPLRIWASKRLRDQYFAERAQLAVLQDRIEPIALSAGYLRRALGRDHRRS